MSLADKEGKKMNEETKRTDTTPKRPWTPGPWKWEFNAKAKTLHLCGGKPAFDLTVMDFKRWGMGGATMRLRDPGCDGLQIMHPVHERQDWLSPEPGREHHQHWHQVVTHPDARLIVAAPDLFEALQSLVDEMDGRRESELWEAEIDDAKAALAKAIGGQP